MLFGLPHFVHAKRFHLVKTAALRQEKKKEKKKKKKKKKKKML